MNAENITGSRKSVKVVVQDYVGEKGDAATIAWTCDNGDRLDRVLPEILSQQRESGKWPAVVCADQLTGDSEDECRENASPNQCVRKAARKVNSAHKASDGWKVILENWLDCDRAERAGIELLE
jgi:hypothetical protein